MFALTFQLMSKKAVNCCCVFVVVFPLIFYMPKFFEFRYEKFAKIYPRTVNCTNYVLEERRLAELAEFEKNVIGVSKTFL